MIKSIFVLLVLYYLASYIIQNLKVIKTDNNQENEQNYWMFTYDFLKPKKESIFDRESIEVLQNKRKKNKLILLLYLIVLLIFIFSNKLLTELLKIILN